MLIFVTTAKEYRTDLIRLLNAHGVFVYVTTFEKAEFTVKEKDTGGVLPKWLYYITSDQFSQN